MKQRLAQLLSTIRCPTSFAGRVVDAYDRWAGDDDAITEERARELLAERIVFADQPKTMMLLLFIALESKDHGAWSRYPEHVFLDTMSAFTRFVEFYREATGVEGYGKASWPLIYVDAKLFRLGALEYELETREGKQEIGIHIPAGTELTEQNIMVSLAKERAFMQEYLPEWVDMPHSCESWMLSPVLETMLPPKSRLRWFRGLFDVVKFNPEVELYLEFVFNLEYFQYFQGIDPHTLREDTSLQRAMKQFVLDGGKPGVGLGYLKKEYRTGTCLAL